MWTIVLIPLLPNAADPVSDFNSCKPHIIVSVFSSEAKKAPVKTQYCCYHSFMALDTEHWVTKTPKTIN